MGVSVDFKLGEVFGRTWKIGWSYKTLWLIQLVPGLFTLLAFPLFPLLNSLFGPIQPVALLRAAYTPAPLPVALGLLLVLAAVYFFLMALVQPATMLGALRMVKGARKLLVRDLLERTLGYYWSILGLYGLFLGAWIFAVLLLGGLVFSLDNSPRALGLVFLTPMLLVLFAAGVASHGLLQLAQAGMLADDLGVWEALLRAGRFFRASLPGLLIFMLLLYLGFYLLSMAFVLPAVPGLVAGTWLTDLSRGLLYPLPSLFTSILPLLIMFTVFFQGILMVFFQAAWAVVYTRLSQQEERPPHPPLSAA
jgi:hypothetical protein